MALSIKGQAISEEDSMQKPIMIIGEHLGDEELRTGRPFAGASGSVLHAMLRQAGIALEECYFTNVFNQKPSGGNVNGFCGNKLEAIPLYRPLAAGKYVKKQYAFELERLWEEIRATAPNVIISMGNAALWAITKKAGLKKYRGSPMETFNREFKVLPTWNPATILRQWELRPIVFSDITKAKVESGYPEIRRPVRYIYMSPSLADIKDFYHKYLENEPYLSCDIETKGETITEVGYGTADGKRAMVIPFWTRESLDGNYWDTAEEERLAWEWVRRINLNHRLIGQNFAYDMQYFWRKMGIPCPHFHGDTMLMHHSLQPEMEKSLGFLGSIYTTEPSWKFMRQDHSTLKSGDD
jgi:uracil-DNA glycosylase